MSLDFGYSRGAGRLLRRRHSLLSPLPLTPLILFGAALFAGWLMIGSETGRAAIGPFALCGAPPHRDCVIDGDTFYLGTQSIRIADIDAPETHPARCTYEAKLGERATHRLRELLNASGFEIRPYERDTDQYGRKLRVIARSGQSIGGILVSEGLARPWGGKREPWCG